MKSSYKVAIVKSGSTYEFFKSSQYEEHAKIWQRIQSAGSLAKNTPQAIQWVRQNEETVFITDGPTLRYVASKLPCDLTTGK